MVGACAISPIPTLNGRLNSLNMCVSIVIAESVIFSAPNPDDYRLWTKVIEYRSGIYDCVKCVMYCTSRVCIVTRREV